MKLLLTSAGISNDFIANALHYLLDKPLPQSTAAFITTAKTKRFIPDHIYYAQPLLQLAKRRISFRLVDPGRDKNWREISDAADLVIIGGGNTFHLLHHARTSGFDQWLVQNATSKVIVGISAGSIILTPSIAIAAIGDGDKNSISITDLTGLGLIDFEISPHSPESVSLKENLAYSRTTSNKLLSLDDQTAVQVDDTGLKIVGGGRWQWYFGGQKTLC